MLFFEFFIIALRTSFSSVDVSDAIPSSESPLQEKNAMSAAEMIAQAKIDAQTQLDIFNKLTNNGEIQGIYAQDGKWYINAELAQIVNLFTQNIFMSGNGDYKLGDFGISRIYVEKDTDTLIMGTQGFAPPEQYGSSTMQGPWTDVYAFAATLYWCITGKI